MPPSIHPGGDEAPDPTRANAFLPHGVSFEDPASAHVYHWLAALSKAAKGMRVYALNNEMLRQFIDDAFARLEIVFANSEELTLTVREERLLSGKDAVHVNSDREDGIPFHLYRNAFRRLTFVRGMTREELVSFLQAMTTDYSAYENAGEDLVSTLWRLAIPHLRYVTIDAISTEAARAYDASERHEVERIQGDIENIVVAVYNATAAGDDIVAGVSITKDDLEALKEIRAETSEDLDLLDVATARAITDISEEQIASVQASLAFDTRDALVRKLMDILVLVLFKEKTSGEFAATVELLQQLFDSLLLGQRYAIATELVRRLQQQENAASDLKQVHITRHLLRLFAAESRVVGVLSAFNESYKSIPVHEVRDFLRSLGPGIAPSLLESLDLLNSPAHRRLVCELILEFGTPDRDMLLRRMGTAKWFVARDILTIAQQLPLGPLSEILLLALKHEHPAVRAHAVGLLRGYARGRADVLIAERILDEDLEVRIAAIRVAAARKTKEARSVLESVLSRENLGDVEPRELRVLMAGYAAIAGSDGITALEKILSPGFFAQLKHTEASIAAAFGLASIGSEAALSVLQKGARSLNSRVRDACKRALARDFDRASEETPPGDAGIAADAPEMPEPPAATPHRKGPEFIATAKGEAPKGDAPKPGPGPTLTRRGLTPGRQEIETIPEATADLMRRTTQDLQDPEKP